MLLTCDSDIGMVFVKMVHTIPSVQSGVVKDPKYL